MEPISIFYLVLLFIFIDISKINHLWNENLHRRALHHQQGIFFNPNKKPWIKFLKTKMNNESIDYINDIKIDKNDSIQTLSPLLSKIFGGNYSKKATLYFNDFDEETQKNLEDIGKTIKPQLEELCGEKLELGNSNFRCVLLRYEGADSEFIPHYDTEPHNCYRTLFLIKKEGNVPPFIHYDEYGNPHKKYLDVGEGLFFKGTRTFHGVGNTGDETMKRYMIGWQYSTDNSIKTKSLCNMFRGASKMEIITTLIPHFIIPLVLSVGFYNFIGGDFTKNQKHYILSSSLISSVIALFFPVNANQDIGTGLPFGLKTLISLLVHCFITIVPPYYALMYYNYLLITEMFLPRTMLVDSSIQMVGNA